MSRGCRLVRAAPPLRRSPELTLLAFGFVLHLPWELWLVGVGVSGGLYL